MPPQPAAETRLTDLAWPIYVPSLVYAVGSSALLPAQVLLALALGFTSAQVALIATWVGAFAVAASLSAGYLVQWFGERRALTVTTAAGVVGLLATWGCVVLGVPGSRWVLVLALTVFDLVDAVWSIARQGLVADLAPDARRGQFMNVYGASQRLGRVAGPFLAAAVLAVGGPEHVFAAAAGVVVLASAIMLAHLPEHPAADPVGVPSASSDVGSSGDAAAAPAAGDTAGGHRRALRGLVLLGLGVLALSAVRLAKETLVPLWGADGLHLQGSTVALIVGIASAMELVLFWPAGLALDRIGRAPVVVTCLTLMGTGLCLMPLLRESWWFVVTAMVVGLGDGVGAGIVKILGIDLAPAQGRGRFLGWWQSIASVGSFVSPALASAVIAVASLAAALPAVGAVGLAGAAWMAWWVPRFLPSRTRVRDGIRLGRRGASSASASG